MNEKSKIKGNLINYKGIIPFIHPSVIIFDGAIIIGDVVIKENSSVWFNSVIRGDVNYIRIGKQTNIQDLSMLHVTNEKYPLVIGDNVTIGHSTSLHGAIIHDNCLIGIGANVLDGSVIHSNSLVAAGSLVREGFVVPERTLVAGVPAKIIRELSDDECDKILNNSLQYVKYAESYFV